MAGGDLLFLSHGYLGDVGSQTSFARNPGMSLFYSGEATQRDRRVAVSALSGTLVVRSEVYVTE